MFKNWKFGLDQAEETQRDGGEECAEGTKHDDGTNVEKPCSHLDTCGFSWNQPSCIEYKCENDLLF